MIESRYRIEYVIPETEKQISKKLQIISYLFLIPLALTFAGAIAYELGYKKIPSDTLALFTKLKTTLFLEQPNSDVIISIENQSDFTIINSEEIQTITKIAIPSISNAIAEKTDLPEDVILESYILDPETVVHEAHQMPDEKLNTEANYTDTNIIPNNDVVEKIEELLNSNKGQLQDEVEKQPATKDLLAQNPAELSSRLNAENNRNKLLKEKLVKAKSDKQTLTNLLKSSHKNAVIKDQNYISALENMDSYKTVFSTDKTTKPLTVENRVKTVKANGTSIDSEKVTANYENSSSLSSNSQVDAIMAAMQGIQIIPTTVKESSYIKLQSHINQLVKEDDAKTGIRYH
jgi:hypothetical protein